MGEIRPVFVHHDCNSAFLIFFPLLGKNQLLSKKNTKSENVRQFFLIHFQCKVRFCFAITIVILRRGPRAILYVKAPAFFFLVFKIMAISQSTKGDAGISTTAEK